MKSYKIEDIRKKYHNEWLLIKIDKMNYATTTPIAGHVLAHSSDRDKIYKQSMRYKGLTYVTHSNQDLPYGCAYAF